MKSKFDWSQFSNAGNTSTMRKKGEKITLFNCIVRRYAATTKNEAASGKMIKTQLKQQRTHTYTYTHTHTYDKYKIGSFISINVIHHFPAGTSSVVTYTPMTELDYGTLLCVATNRIGRQRVPCVYHVIAAGN